jgi:hypothetical protein
MSVAEAIVLEGIQQAERLPHVTAALQYIAVGESKPRSYMYEPPPGVPQINATYQSHSTTIRSLRPIAHRLSLDVEGFRLLNHRSEVQDFYSDDEVRDRHYPEIEKLVAQATGAACVVVFDHTVRSRREGVQLVAGRVRRDPVPRVHNDYTVKSGPQRVRELFADEAEALLRRRFSIFNVWRPIRGPLEDQPLALVDARSVAAEDFVATDLLYKDRTGEIYNVRHNPAHRWFYAPRMSRDEVLLFRSFDSAEDGRPRFVPHAAFEDPTAPRNALPRESIELLTLAFY